MRLFIHLAYDGTRYHGWQIQPNGISVEGEIERCLSTLLRRPIDIIGAGRTDAGVHARHMVAHFDFPEKRLQDDDSIVNHSNLPLPSCAQPHDLHQLTYKLNRILPPDIFVYSIEHVSDDMHARFSATSRTYHYYVCTRRDPFKRQFSWLTHFDLDFPLMNQAARQLVGRKDFACFCKSHTDVKTTICDVTEAAWIQVDEYNWYFRIKANRFLRNMVRAVVGTLVEVGRHRMTLEGFRQVIDGKKRTLAGESMPGNALFLENIEY